MAVIGFSIAGSDYAVPAGGHANVYIDLGVVDGYVLQGNFTICSNGSYTFTVDHNKEYDEVFPDEKAAKIASGMAMEQFQAALDNLDLKISYTIESADGQQATSELFINQAGELRDPGYVFGTSGDDTIAVGAGDHTIFGGDGHDTYMLAGLLGGTDTIKDWQDGDKLNIVDVLSSHGGSTLAEVLDVQWNGADAFTGASGGVSISLSIDDAGRQAIVTVTDGGNSKTIVMEGYDFGSQVHGHDDAAAQALLQHIIVTT